jgi:LysR family transcriptional activator of nhaA
MAQLNYKHLRYFWAVARAGSLTLAAERLSVSASSLSVQLRQLETALGHDLFDRSNRRLVLTEAGGIALDFANTIFAAGDELVRTLEGGAHLERQRLRVGAVATLSRNFQMQLLRPLIGRDDVELIVRTGSLQELLSLLDAHALDVVLSNLAVPREASSAVRSHRLAEQTVSLVQREVEARRRGRAFVFPDDLDGLPVLLPGWQNNVRAGFDLIVEQTGVRPVIVAEVDDMPMLRLLARDGAGAALVPPVVVMDELAQGVLQELCHIDALRESFYAITLSRRFPNPLLGPLFETFDVSGRHRPPGPGG